MSSGMTLRPTPFHLACRILALFALLPLPAAEPGADWMAGFQIPVVEEPVIPDRSANVTDFGAVPDGKTLNTAAIAAGIEQLAAQGGGRLVFPAGIWLTGPIVLRSNIELHTEEGALIQFTKDHTQFSARGQIFGEDLENVAITGRGIFDGAGEAWRPVKRFKMTERQWQALVASGGRLEPDGQIWHPRPDGATWRPRLLVLHGCRRVLLEDATFQNSPGWNVNPSFCDDVTVRNVTIRNPWFSQNGDGLDLESCRNVVIRGARLDVGDDALCLKSGAGAEARRHGRPTENVLIEDCVVYHGHGGFTIGSEMSGGVRNVRVNNCTFIGTDVGLRFKTTRGRGGVVERIYIGNIRMTDIPTEAISFNMYYGGAGPGNDPAGGFAEVAAMPVDEGTPQFRDIFMENIVCRGARRAVQLQGLPEMPLRGIHLRASSFTAEQGIVCQDAADIVLSGVEVLPRRGPVVELIGSRGIAIDQLAYPAGAESLIRLQGARNNEISVRRTDTRGAKQPLALSGGAEPDAVAFE